MPKSAEEPSSNGNHQNIARATLVLDALARSADEGLRLTDVSRVTSLSKTAAHRCLAGLVEHGLASYDPPSSLFFLGDRILAWVGLADRRYEIAERIKPYLRRLADKSGDAVYFSVRRGDESVCYGRAEGSYPIKTLTLNVGDRRPLGVGSGSMAILAFLDAEEIKRVLDAHTRDRSAYPVSEQTLSSMLKDAQNQGYALMGESLIPGMGAIGVPVRDPNGRVKAALSVAAISERVNAPRRSELVADLQAESARLTDELPELLTAL